MVILNATQESKRSMILLHMYYEMNKQLVINSNIPFSLKMNDEKQNKKIFDGDLGFDVLRK
jgi:hypothetical protein